MDHLCCLDIWNHILTLLSDKEKFSLIMTCQGMMRCRFTFDEPHKLRQIKKSSLFDHFDNVQILKNDKIIFPLNIKKIYFDWGFKESIKNLIPDGVTHVEFTSLYTNCIYDYLPSSVTHLTLGPYCLSNNNTKIPHVTHLAFQVIGSYMGDKQFGEYLLRYVPSTVSHLDLPLMEISIDNYYGKIPDDFYEKMKNK